MLVRHRELKDLLIKALSNRGIGGEIGVLIADDYLNAEIEGVTTHGLGRFLAIDKALRRRLGPYEETLRLPSLATIDGRRELGQIVAIRASRLAAALAQANGIGCVTIRNTSRYNRLTPYACTIAEHGLVAIITNNAGPAAVAPFGSTEPVLGTNPIAFGFPRKDAEPYVIDFGTSDHVWGEVRQAALERRHLRGDSFLDSSGKPTSDPSRVHAIRAFGGQKGSALCAAIELIAGLLGGGLMGKQVNDEYDLAGVFIAVRPPSTEHTATTCVVDNLLNEIREAKSDPSASYLGAPGDLKRARRTHAIEVGLIDVHDETVRILRRMAQGGPGLIS